MTSQEFIGVDLGGTKFSMARVADGQLVDKRHCTITSDGTMDEVLSVLTDQLDTLKAQNVAGIGIGVPGIVNPETGIIYDIQNIPSWKEVPLQKLLEERYGVPVQVNNDANCFVLGEKRFGKGKPFTNFVGMSIGTGLGMGVIINNQLYNGVMCGAGEIGMIPYKNGIMEEYAGSFFFEREFQHSAKELHQRTQQGDTMAIEAFQQFGVHLGEAVKIVLFMYAPEAIIFGGSISKAFPYFEETLRKTVQTFDYPRQIADLKIAVSDQADSAILGASSLCM